MMVGMFLTLPLLVTCCVLVTAIPANFKENYEAANTEDNSAGMAFFDAFQSMFGWNDPVTLAPTTAAPLTRPPHLHTGTKVPYYGGHLHRGSLPTGKKPKTAHALPSQPTPKPPAPAPSMYGSQRPYPYQYPASPYYNSPFYGYNPYYTPSYPGAPFYRPGQSSAAPVVPSQLNSTKSDPLSLRTPKTDIDEETAAESHFPNKHVSEHRAVPNKAPSKEPVFPMPFPVTKSFLPLSVLPPEDCHSEAGLVGECLSAAECGATSGQPSGLCHMGRDVSLHARVCCTYPAHCGYETNHRVTYFKSPAYPEPSSLVSDCPLSVDLLPGVCQVRLDFLDFQMKPIHQGVCDMKNSLLIKSNKKSTVIPMPRLCGNIATGQEDPLRTDVPHLYTYFDVDSAPEKGVKKVPNKDMRPTLELHFNVENYPSLWNIRVSQIVCDGANLQAPTGCSQYYNSNSGNITSINLPDGEYMTDTSLDICLARDPTACAIKYKLAQMGVGPTKGGGLGYGLVCDDFLKFRGEKTGICGKGDGREMVLPLRGNVGLTFQSDGSNIPGADVGYRIEYEYLHNCHGVQYYKYPSTK